MSDEYPPDERPAELPEHDDPKLYIEATWYGEPPDLGEFEESGADFADEAFDDAEPEPPLDGV